ncbi:MAG: filamentous hemagglutinin N-terminal domain-containing protein [Pseudobdellovibrionaceae bacterium]
MSRGISKQASRSVSHFLAGSTSIRTSKVAALMFAAGVLALPHAALAVGDDELPLNPNVVGGAATFDSPNINLLNINQSTDRVVINWDKFNIGKNSTVEFFQPNSGSLAVNQVFDPANEASFIDGVLKANGRVAIVNSNGVFISSTAVIDVGGILATTGSISVDQVMSGSSQIDILDMHGSATVENQGSITVADGGLAAFVSPVVRNGGTITAHLGKVAMASGSAVTLDLYGDQLVEIKVPPTSAAAQIANDGLIDAAGGTIDVRMDVSGAIGVVDSVINNEGIVQATSAKMVGGKIVLSAGGSKAVVEGEVKAGKSVNITGKSVTLPAGSIVTAGDDESAGDVVVFASDKLNYNGYINAYAGSVETSAVRSLTVGSDAEVLASTWLLDPLSIDIDDVAALGVVYSGAIQDALNDGTDVTVRTNAEGPDAGNIDLFALINWTTDAALTFDAINDIHFDQGSGLSSTSNANITLIAGDDVRLGKTTGTGISTMGGDVSITSGDITYIRAGNIVDANGGNILIDNGGALLAEVDTLRTTGDGTITVNQNKTEEVLSPALAALYSIQSVLNAISNTGSGLNTINVGAGTWNENIKVYDSNVLLRGTRAGINGAGHAASGIDASTLAAANGNDYALEINGGTNVTVDGFDIEGGYGVGAFYGSDVTVQNNAVSNSSQNGIRFSYVYGDAEIAHNAISSSGLSGIYADGGYYGGLIDLNIHDNSIYNSTWNGISLSYMNGTFRVTDNLIDSSWYGHGIVTQSLGEGYYYPTLSLLTVEEEPVAPLLISGNEISYSGQNGIYLSGLNLETEVSGNYIYSSGSNGILVSGNGYGYDRYYYGGYYGSSSDVALRILGNDIYNSYYSGVNLQSINGDILVDDNGIYNSYYGSGVLASNVNGTDSYDGYYGYYSEGYYGSDVTRQLIISNNYITESGFAGVELENVGGYVSVDSNEIYNSGEYGVYAYNSGYYGGYYGYYGYSSSTPVDLHITNNIIENDVYDGYYGGEDFAKAEVFSEGYYGGYYGNGYAGVFLNVADGYAELSDNTIGGAFDYGVMAVSGTVDLTGGTNTIHDTGVGLAFYPDYGYKGYYGYAEEGDYDYFAELAARLHLVNDTIGTTAFIDQSEAFIELGYGAFFDPGRPTLLDGMNATYTLSGVTIAPAVSGFVTDSELATLEGMIYHYNDEQDRGLFFFAQEDAGNVDQKDIFQNFGLFFQEPPSGSLTITGLPSIGGLPGAAPAPAFGDFANIAPAAGEEEDQDQQNPENVEPAAGADASKASCWSDANQALGQGSSVVLDYGVGASGLIDDAANCGASGGETGILIGL